MSTNEGTRLAAGSEVASVNSLNDTVFIKKKS